MSGYTKLSPSLLSSTIWNESAETCKLWVTMLAMADFDGFVAASLPGLSHQARLSRQQTESGLSVLESPDADSRTDEHEGRRIAKVAGGWKILNYVKYQQMMNRDERNARHADYMREKRRANGINDVGNRAQPCADVSDVAHSVSDSDSVSNNKNKNNSMVAGAPGVEVLHVTRLSEQTCEGLADAKAVKNAKAFKAKLLELPDWLPREVWDNFRAHRQKLRKPMTDHAEKLALRELEKLRASGNDPTAVIEQAIYRGWQGLFPIGESNGTHSKSDRLAETLRQIDKA